MTIHASGGLQSMNGVVVIDKPPGLSSARVVSVVKHLFRAAKAGHAGTLDPFATGILIVCLNQATKLTRFWLNGVKTYQAELCLGIETDTQDPTGTIISTSTSVHVSENDLRSTVKSFIGTTDQFPPVFSALKHNGVPLYRLARKGEAVQKPARQIHISQLDIHEINLPFVRLEIRCGAGTYIRTLCADIGKKLGCGAYLKQLRRTACGRFAISSAVSLSELENLEKSGQLASHLTGMSESLPDMVSFKADKSLTDRIKYGMMLTTEDVPVSKISPEKMIKIIDDYGQLLAILEYDAVRERYLYCCSFG